MTNFVQLLKNLLIYGSSITLALVLGYNLADPLQRDTVLLIGAILGILSLPFFISWHHAFLLATWNSALVIFFLPGELPIYILSAFLSFGLAVLSHSVNKSARFLNVPSVTWPLLFLAIVVLVTAKVTGGIGMYSLGSSSYGGKQFMYLLAAIAGYFALTSRKIPPERTIFWASMFFLTGVTDVISNIVYFSKGYLDFLLRAFPLMLLGGESSIIGDFGEKVFRLSGLAFAAEAFIYFLLIRFGIRHIFDLRHGWRLALFFAAFLAVFFGGFRSILVLISLVFSVQFFLEKLHHTRLAFYFALFGVLIAAGILIFSDKMPLPVQRTISFLPVQLDPMVVKDAKGSSEWRFSMWKTLWPQVPEHLLIGKGFKIDSAELFMAAESQRRGWGEAWDVQVAVGNYHSGPLSLILPLGIFGVIGFFWFLAAGCRVVYRNYKYGIPSLQIINSFLFALFVMRIIFYFFLYGSFFADLYHFTGIIGLSICLNGGMIEPKEEDLYLEEEAIVRNELVEVAS